MSTSAAVAKRYAETLLQNNVGSIEKLRWRLKKSASFLSELKVFDEDDIEDILGKLASGIASNSNSNSNATAAVTKMNYYYYYHFLKNRC